MVNNSSKGSSLYRVSEKLSMRIAYLQERVAAYSAVEEKRRSIGVLHYIARWFDRSSS